MKPLKRRLTLPEPKTIFVVGQDARTHAIIEQVCRSVHPTKIWCTGSNAGIATEMLSSNGSHVECLPHLTPKSMSGIIEFCRQQRPDWTLVVPDDPLAMGTVDRLMQGGHAVWGPTQQASRFEWDKAYSKNFMREFNIPTADFACGTAEDLPRLRAKIREFAGLCVVKASGLALGKGAFVCSSVLQADKILVKLLSGSLGDAGRTVVVEKRLYGMEASIQVVCDGKHTYILPSAMDFKRLRLGNRGPMTGGMGAISPNPFLSGDMMEKVRRLIINPWLAGCKKRDIVYKGILYPGIMIDENGDIYVLEFNARFGDPEAQAVLPRLLDREAFVEMIKATLTGTVDRWDPRWDARSVACVVKASPGYPDSKKTITGRPITGIKQAERLNGVKVYSAATKKVGRSLVTNGGRVVTVRGRASGLENAIALANKASAIVKSEGFQSRSDIGKVAIDALRNMGKKRRGE